MKKPVMKLILGLFASLFVLGAQAQIGGGPNDPGDCNCDPAEEAPVCVVDEMGNTFVFPSACFAECLGFTVVGDGDCDFGGGDPGDGGGDPFPNDYGCEFTDDFPVCVEDEMGNIIPFPSACLAECFGLVVVGEGDCDFGGGDPGNGGGGDPFPNDCGCELIDETPICVADEMGNIFLFPSACLAECFGLVVVGEGDCDFGGGDPGNGGGGDPFPNDCGCDMNDEAPICVADEMGNIFPFPNACLAECFGLMVVGDGDCDFGGGDPGNGGGDPFPNECGCDMNDEAPICVADEMGNIFPFPNACLAECFGLEVVGEGDCDFGGGDPGNGGGGDPFPNDCGCDMNDEAPICVADEMGNIFPFPNACLAECFGLEVVGEGDCDFGGGDPGNGGGGDPFPNDCGCELIDETPICVADEMGNIFLFPSACLAECFGLVVVGEGDCDFGGGDPGNGGGGDPFPNECDCDFNDDAPVCASDNMGNVMPFPNACLAECLGFTIVDGDCGFDGNNPGFPEVEFIPNMNMNSNGIVASAIGTISSISVYPNPVSKNVNLVFEAKSAGLVTTEVLNLTGQKIMSVQTSSIDGSQQIQLDIESLEPGIYLVRLIPSSGTPVTEKVIKK